MTEQRVLTDLEKALRMGGQVMPAVTLKDAIAQGGVVEEPPAGVDFGTRAKLGFASSNAVKKVALEGMFGKGNVVEMDGNLMYRSKPDEAFRRVDPEEFESGDIADIIGDIPEMALGTVGSVYGGIPGAAIGGMAGSGLKMGIANALGLPESNTPQNIAAQVGLGGVEAGVGEGAGRLLSKGIAKAAAPFASKVQQSAVDISNFLRQQVGRLDRYGFSGSARLLPAEATESWGLDVLQNVAEGSAFGGSSIAAFKEARSKGLEATARTWANTISQSIPPDELGRMTLSTIDGNLKAADFVPDAMYKDLQKKFGSKVVSVTLPDGTIKHELSSGLYVDITPLKKFFEPIALKGRAAKGIGATEQGYDLANKIMTLEDRIPFDVAKELRTTMRNLKTEMAIINKKAPTLGLAAKAEDALSGMIGNALKDVDPAAYATWNTARKLYQANQAKFNNSFIRSLIRKSDPKYGGQPETIARDITSSISRIRRVNEALAGDQGARDKLQSWFIKDLFDKCTNEQTKVVSGSQLAGKIRDIGDDTLRELLGPERLDYLKKLTSAYETIQAKQASGVGGVGIQLTQWGAVVGLATGNLTTPSAVVLAGPYAVAKLILTENGSKWLTNGFKVAQGSPAMSTLVGRITMLGKLQQAAEDASDAAYESDTEAPDRITIPIADTLRNPGLINSR